MRVTKIRVLLTLSLFLVPLAVGAQEGRTYKIGLLTLGAEPRRKVRLSGAAPELGCASAGRALDHREYSGNHMACFRSSAYSSSSLSCSRWCPLPTRIRLTRRGSAATGMTTISTTSSFASSMRSPSKWHRSPIFGPCGRLWSASNCYSRGSSRSRFTPLLPPARRHRRVPARILIVD